MELYEISAWQGDCWRLIHQSPTKLTDSDQDDELLNALIASSSKSYPPEFAGMAEMLARPFCIDRIYPRGSRFRRPGLTRGVYYAAEKIETALAEAAFYLILDYVDAKSVSFSKSPKMNLGIEVPISTNQSVNIFDADKHNPALLSLTDYSAAQNFAEQMRDNGVELIRYPSVRDKNKGANLAVLCAKCIVTKKPVAQQIWSLSIDRDGITASEAASNKTIIFDRNYFAADPRLADFNWQR